MRERARWFPAVLVLLTTVASVLSAPTAAAKSSSLERARAEANRVAAEWARAQTRLSRVEAEVRSLQTRKADTEHRLVGLQGALRVAAIDQFVKGRSQKPAMGFQDDASAQARADALAGFVTVDARDAVDRYRELAQDLQRDEQALAARRRQSRATAAELRRRVNRIQGVLAGLERLEAARLARDAARQRAGRRSTGSVRVFRAIGDWMCPVQGPRAFSNDFGNARGGGRRRHQGNDILARRGTPVVAPVSGSVRRHDNRLGGISFYLTGNDGITYYGAHLQRFAPVSGRVRIGTVIGYVGTTGNAQGGPPHLHFEMKPGGGRSVNPYYTLRAYC